MASDSVDRISVDQEQVIIPDLTIKDLLSSIPYVDVSPPSHSSSTSSSSFFRAHCFKRNGWRSSLYLCVSLCAVRCHVKFDAYIPPASRILLLWPLSTRPPLSSMPVSTLTSFSSQSQSFTAPQNSLSGLYTPSGLVSSLPGFGSSPTNVATRPSLSPNWSITPSVGSSTPRMSLPRFTLAVALIIRQSRSSISLVAYFACQASCFHRSPDPRSALRSKVSFLPRRSAL